jgi:hypothetical protein
MKINWKKIATGLEIFYLGVPLLIILWVLFSKFFSYSPISVDSLFYEQWKNTWHTVWYLNLISAPFYFYSLVKAYKEIKNVFKRWILTYILGMFLLVFSYATAGLMIDLGYLFYFLFLKVIGQPLPLKQ